MSKLFNDAANTSPERREAFSASSKFELSRLPHEVLSSMIGRTNVVNKAVYRLEKNPTFMYDVNIVSNTPKPVEHRAILGGTDSRLDKAGGSIVNTTDDPLTRPHFSSEIDEQVYNLKDARARIEISSLPAKQMGYNLPPDADVVLLPNDRNLANGA